MIIKILCTGDFLLVLESTWFILYASVRSPIPLQLTYLSYNFNYALKVISDGKLENICELYNVWEVYLQHFMVERWEANEIVK